MDRLGLDGRTALVTGASRGIGAATLVHDPIVLEADLADAETR